MVLVDCSDISGSDCVEMVDVVEYIIGVVFVIVFVVEFVLFVVVNGILIVFCIDDIGIFCVVVIVVF